MLLLFNKKDSLMHADVAYVEELFQVQELLRTHRMSNYLYVSALTGEGCDLL